jgi:predicted O-methyltransferase YrrM
VPLVAAVRRRAPDRIRHDPRLRSAAVAAGLIPPRTLHFPEEAALLERLAAGARRAVEIGVYEGASAARLARSLPAGAELHLIDPFGPQPTALRAGQRGTAWASRRVVARAARGRSVRCVWHVAYSQDVGRRWELPIDLLFIDGDHSEGGTREDWVQFSRHVQVGGHVAFHDARANVEGMGLPGPTAVVAELFGPEGTATDSWSVVDEVRHTVVVRRHA